MHISQNPNTRKKLLHSLEVAHYWKQIVTVAVLFLIFGSVLYLRQLSLGILFTLMVLPCLIFYGYRIWQIFRCADRYIFCRVALTVPQHNYWAKAYSFAVTLDHPEIGRRSRQTRAIFQTYGLIPPLMEDYVNQTVIVAYNPATETLVVIG